MRTDLFDYNLPHSFIAQQPADPRDSSRLLVLERASGRIEHRTFWEIGRVLRRGDLLVANNSRVIPARLHGRKDNPQGRRVEIFLLRALDDSGRKWTCLVRGRGLGAGTTVFLNVQSLQAEILAVAETGTRTVRFSEPIQPHLHQIGELGLPPYIHDFCGDQGRYQTVYSRSEGSVAAPTAGLHFTPELLLDLQKQGIGWEVVTLHIGLDTFRPVTAEQVEQHEIHTEWAELTAQAAQSINQAQRQGGRIVAVGTTTTRTLEFAAATERKVTAFAGPVDLFIRPGYRFHAVDVLLTNLHMPRSSLLMLVSAFVGQAHPEEPDRGRRMLLDAYEVAKAEGYRFFSFGDAMLIV